MFISLHELGLHHLDFQEEFRPDTLDLGPDVRQRMPLKSSGRAQLVEEHHGRRGTLEDIRIAGDLSTGVELFCARCLEPVVHNIQRDFDLLYRPQGADAGVKEAAVQSTEAEISYYTGEGLLLEDVLREQVLLSVPLRVLCREDCRGLCRHCGRNLNVEQCSCVEQPDDPRWSALKEIKNKRQH
ncbi:MAG TPA: DUF177 domain-containing protein [Terriglobales bacterium]|nr:DUF177 domain-containing protein [Terriglobales bacterium]